MSTPNAQTQSKPKTATFNPSTGNKQKLPGHRATYSVRDAAKNGIKGAYVPPHMRSATKNNNNNNNNKAEKTSQKEGNTARKQSNKVNIIIVSTISNGSLFRNQTLTQTIATNGVNTTTGQMTDPIQTQTSEIGLKKSNTNGRRRNLKKLSSRTASCSLLTFPHTCEILAVLQVINTVL